jgi:predicted DNA-binding mobile mystery protein A
MEALMTKKAEMAASRARTALDEKFAHIDPTLLTPPVRGWIRALRDALNMSTSQLANRMGVTRSAIAQLERSEVKASVRLETLRRAADALDCDLVYALVPRVGLEESVRRQGGLHAARVVSLVHRTMLLEDQGLTPLQLQKRLDHSQAAVQETSALWDDPE